MTQNLLDWMLVKYRTILSPGPKAKSAHENPLSFLVIWSHLPKELLICVDLTDVLMNKYE